MRLAEVFREHVAIDVRPTKATDNLLEGYSRNAEEIVVHVSHALVIDCINRGSGAILKLHISQMQDARQASGPEKAQAMVDELINYFYLYPRYYVKELMGEGSGVESRYHLDNTYLNITPPDNPTFSEGESLIRAILFQRLAYKDKEMLMRLWHMREA